jgi:hypothetical protein
MSRIREIRAKPLGGRIYLRYVQAESAAVCAIGCVSRIGTRLNELS